MKTRKLSSVVMKQPEDIFFDRCSRLACAQLCQITRGQYEQLIEDAKAARVAGIALTIGGRGTKLYPQMSPYIHFATRASISSDAIEVRGNDLLVGVEVPVERVIEQMSAFA